jgi:hypothetical protein
VSAGVGVAHVVVYEGIVAGGGDSCLCEAALAWGQGQDLGAAWVGLVEEVGAFFVDCVELGS